MQSAKKAMITIINRCVDFNQASNGLKLVPNYESCSLVGKIYEILEAMEENFPQRIIHQHIDSHFYENPEIETDILWLHENISCLLSNALRYSFFGDEVYLFVEEIEENNNHDNNNNNSEAHIKITVIDAGLGVKKEERYSLFSFHASGTQEQTGGAGLGLYTLASRVRAMNGQFGYYDNQTISSLNQEENNNNNNNNKYPKFQKGSTFWFQIPKRQPIFLSRVPTATTPRSTSSNVLIGMTPLANQNHNTTLRRRKKILNARSPSIALYQSNAEFLRAKDFLMESTSNCTPNSNTSSSTPRNASLLGG
jgi:signal transduction histidine kinase